ncbi:hypothetical protein GCM10023093_17780 [Nemorincola caseinilytica]|uniref:GIY-YIG homing endonuclease n=1 Tax=Nemorincola caseinilytica TaxID=2054315 RepID=A0ABP8NHE1_9BACT
MDFSSIDDIKAYGFIGFKTVADLILDSSCLPNQMGVYFVLHMGKKPPMYLPVGSGGHFKGKDPNVSTDVLRANWIANTHVVYIGKAGGTGRSATIKSRLKQYLNFGQGKNVGHWGGRLIWQLSTHRDLVICWKSLMTQEPRDVEEQLLRMFIKNHGSRPFANLVT